MNELHRESNATHREIFDRPLGLCSVVGFFGHLYFAIESLSLRCVGSAMLTSSLAILSRSKKRRVSGEVGTI